MSDITYAVFDRFEHEHAILHLVAEPGENVLHALPFATNPASAGSTWARTRESTGGDGRYDALRRRPRTQIRPVPAASATNPDRRCVAAATLHVVRPSDVEPLPRIRDPIDSRRARSIRPHISRGEGPRDVLVKGHAGESPAVRTALAPAAERTFRLRPGFIDIQPSAIDLHSV